ncbi:hypothetical protein CIB95_00575 [Lottiidibacillus patelloidae]|uniref:Uncharacterized protein n=1 Tax=Lottiidibacillus patelloidae TaxID=2670334 RepID=A0A263BXS2_9BACI|nr:hypothetical protein [Lottiidibacillus patelloidae]OZM58107.1 hypothetical protein CIB95_00575 [Lottiidibacillus patelloidae]
MNSSTSTPRHPKAIISSFINNFIYIRNPYIIMWWSAALPGFGHIMLCRYFIGSILIIWEFYINSYSGLNEAILYSFIGEFEKAKEVLNPRIATLYIPVYFFAIWDSRRITIELNKMSILADQQKAPIFRAVISPLDLNYLEIRKPKMAIIYSILCPGLGQLYLHNYVMGFYLLLWWVITIFKSNIIPALPLFLIGDFEVSTSLIAMQWFLFIPSIFGFSIYNAFVASKELNKMFKLEQARYFNKEFANSSIFNYFMNQKTKGE